MVLLMTTMFNMNFKVFQKSVKEFLDRIKPYLKLVSAIFYQIFIKFLFLHQMIPLQKLWKMFFISSQKLFSFSRYSIFCNFSPSFPNFPDSKGQMEVE